uniref:Wall-associated receptor kinase galacturonan-binding domain-containing protein n=1 Tax=Hordeum vulgare subsp. vulgare TaxID=112509 RepID=A0A8I6X265_HORVV
MYPSSTVQPRYPLSYTYLHRHTAKSSSLPMATASCWFLVLVWVWWLPLTLAAGTEEQQGEGCSSSIRKCGNLTISHPFWLPELETERSCGPLDFEVNCLDGTPVLRSSGNLGFAIIDISYEERSLHVVDLYKEEDFNHSKSCHFPRRNTSSKLPLPFKVNPTNLNLIFYNCTKPAGHRDTTLVEMRCGKASNTFVRAGVRYDATRDYASYALQGCNAIVVPVLDSSADYEQLIRDGFLLTWVPPPARKFTDQIIF